MTAAGEPPSSVGAGTGHIDDDDPVEPLVDPTGPPPDVTTAPATTPPLPPSTPLHGRAARVAAKQTKPTSTTRSIVEWVLVLGGALLVALVIRMFLFTTFWIPSASMQPTLVGQPNRHDRVVVNRLSYKLHDVHRGDIVVFTTPKEVGRIEENGQEVKDLIKRVVGLPGETITLRDSKVLVDGKALAEPYLAPGTPTDPLQASGCDGRARFVVPAGKVLVMGDNRTNSQDGRCFGPIKQSSILGRAFVRIWPLNHINWL